MSIYKPQNSPYYAFDFQLKRRRFCGSTGSTSRTEAQKIERAKRSEAAKQLQAEAAAGAAPLTVDAAAARYWLEVGQYHRGSDTTFANLERLVAYFGKAKRIDQIGDDDVAKLVAWRRAQRAGNSPKRPFVSNATVNRSTVEPLQKMLNRAAESWKVTLPLKPDWKLHLLPEPQERVREVRGGEEEIIAAAIRPDYLPIVKFARLSGLREAECLLRKDDVDLADGTIWRTGKGGKRIRKPISTAMRTILMAEMANPTEFVFTYVAHRAVKGGNGHVRGARLSITASGLKSIWRRSKSRKSGAKLPADLRFHDLRHDFATKLLRETRNLRLVQIALGHSKIETTTKYAHVLEEEVLAGMEAMTKTTRK